MGYFWKEKIGILQKGRFLYEKKKPIGSGEYALSLRGAEAT